MTASETILKHWPRLEFAMHDASPYVECSCGTRWYGEWSREIDGLRAQWAAHLAAAIGAHPEA